MDDLVAIAKIVKPRGLRGEVVAELLTDFQDRFEGLGNVVAVSPDGTRRDMLIENFWFQNNRVVLKFERIDSVEAAEDLRDLEICVLESEVVELEDDEFFDWQLEGCQVETVGGEPIGTVRELMRTGGTELLVVESDQREYLIPFAEAICVTVDVDEKRIVIDPPEGLLEF